MAQMTPKEAFCQPHKHKSFFFFLLLHTRRSCSSIVCEKDQTHCCIIIQTLFSVINNKRKPSLRENSPTCLPPHLSDQLREPLALPAVADWLWDELAQWPGCWHAPCSGCWCAHGWSWALLGNNSTPCQEGGTVFSAHRDTLCTDYQPAICFLPRLREVFCQDTHLFHRLASQHFKWALLPAGTLRATQVLQKKTGVRCWGGAQVPAKH